MEELQSCISTHGLAVSSLPDKGRCLVSTRSFAPGEVIISQEPYVCIPNNPSAVVRCDGCFASGNLKKCSACRMTWYCGSTCQKSEWKLHQLECQTLASLTEDRRKMLTPSIRLMVRLVLKKKLQSEQVMPTTTVDNYSLVEALTAHMSDIGEEKLVLYAQMANLVNLLLPSMEINIKEITQNFSKLACNAHTICDSELRPLGTGLYPVISIINHSCLPNSILVFEEKKAVVRVVENIPKGAEGLYEDIQESSVLEGYRCKDKKCDGFLLLDSEKKLFTCQQCGLSRNRQEIKSIESEVKQMLDEASKIASSGNYFEASAMYKTIEQLQLKLCHSHSISLLRTQETLLKILMELKDWREALVYCRSTIPVYQRVYPAIHPLLGLQYYTCGKLEWFLGDTENAFKSLTKAADILRITHGTKTHFMKEFLNLLEEARAEAAYMQTSRLSI